MSGQRARAYWELTKPGITRLVLLTTGAGFYLASRDGVDLLLLAHTLLGTGLVASGTNALNQYWERDVDARMHRTRRRPLPSGRLRASEALLFAWLISIAGIAYLVATVNLQAAIVVTLSLTTYIFLYTPLKKRTPLSTLVGAVPGALPIVAGWVAAGGGIGADAAALFALLFLWQVPHFLALAWIYREDYGRGGLAALSVVDSDGRRTARQALLCTTALLAVSILPSALGLTGGLYLIVALVCGAGFLYCGARFARGCTKNRAGLLFRASVVYLPVLLLFMIVDKLPA